MLNKSTGKRISRKLSLFLTILISATALLVLAACNDSTASSGYIMEEAPAGAVEDAREVAGEEAAAPAEDTTTVETEVPDAAETGEQPAETEVTVTYGAPEVRATNLIEFEVTNPAGETLGQVEDLMIDRTSGQADYVVVAFENVPEIEQSLKAVPLNALTADAEQSTLVVEAEQQTLQAAPGFEMDNWPDTTNPDWASEIDTFWETEAQVSQAPRAEAAAFQDEGKGDQSALRASELLGYQVVDREGEPQGQLEDLMIDLANGQINYIAVSLEGFEGIGQKLYAVPAGVVSIDSEQEQVILRMNQDVLVDAPGFEEGDWPDTLDPEWDLPIQEFWANVPLEMLNGGTQATEPAVTDLPTGEQNGMDRPRIDEAAIRISDFLRYEVINSSGESLGEIEDAVIGLESGQAKYAILSFGGFLGFGDDLFAIPWQVLSLDPAQALVTLNVDQETLENAPSFEASDQLDTFESRWDVGLREYWDEDLALLDPEARQTVSPVGDETLEEPAISAEELLDYRVINVQLEDLGEVEDLTIGLESGRVNYAVVETEDFFEFNESLFAVPLGALEIDPLRSAAVFAVDEETLENAPGFDEDNWPAMANPRWDVDSSEYWQRTGIWTPVPAPVPGVASRAMDEVALRASEMLDYSVVNTDREQVGTVEDFVVAAQSGQISFVALSFEGLENLGDELYPIPSGSFVIDPANEVIIFDVVDIETLAGAPSFAPDNWPAMNETDWVEPLRDYWFSATLIGEPGLRVSELLGQTVVSWRDQEPVGQIEELLVGLTSNFVNYAVLSLDTAEASDQLYPIPYDLFRLDAEEAPPVMINVDETLLQSAPGFPADDWPETSTPLWDAVYLDFWGEGVTSTATEMATNVIISEAGVRTEALLDMDVMNLLDEELGEIEDLILDLQTEQVLYAVIAADRGFFDFGGQFFLVPLNSLSIDPVSEEAILDIAEETIEAGPVFDRNSWLNLTDPDWTNSYFDYWEGVPDLEFERATDGNAILNRNTIRLSELLDYDVENPQDEELGEIEDMMIGLDTGQVNYVVLSFDEDFFDLALFSEEFYAIPLSAMALDRSTETMIFDVPRETLENAPGFTPPDWPDTANPQWDIEARTFWEEQGQEQN